MGCKHPSHSLPLRSLSKLQLSHESQNERLCPWHIKHGSQTVKTMLRGRLLKDPKHATQQRQEGTAAAPSQSLPVTSEASTKQAASWKSMSSPWADYEKNPNTWSSIGENFSQIGTLCMSTFVFLCGTVVSWRKKVVLWGGKKRLVISVLLYAAVCESLISSSH